MWLVWNTIKSVYTLLYLLLAVPVKIWALPVSVLLDCALLVYRVVRFIFSRRGLVLCLLVWLVSQEVKDALWLALQYVGRDCVHAVCELMQFYCDWTGCPEGSASRALWNHTDGFVQFISYCDGDIQLFWVGMRYWLTRPVCTPNPVPFEWCLYTDYHEYQVAGLIKLTPDTSGGNDMFVRQVVTPVLYHWNRALNAVGHAVVPRPSFNPVDALRWSWWFVSALLNLMWRALNHYLASEGLFGLCEGF